MIQNYNAGVARRRIQILRLWKVFGSENLRIKYRCYTSPSKEIIGSAMWQNPRIRRTIKRTLSLCFGNFCPKGMYRKQLIVILNVPQHESTKFKTLLKFLAHCSSILWFYHTPHRNDGLFIFGSFVILIRSSTRLLPCIYFGAYYNIT